MPQPQTAGAAAQGCPRTAAGAAPPWADGYRPPPALNRTQRTSSIGPSRPRPPRERVLVRPAARCRHLVFRRGAGAVRGVGMFLTTVLFRKRIPGHQWIGKYRRPRVVTIAMKQAMIRRLEIEAENEYWLSRPYLTREQEYKHNTEERRARWEAFKSRMRAKLPEHRYISDDLNHLNVTRRWTT